MTPENILKYLAAISIVLLSSMIWFSIDSKWNTIAGYIFKVILTLALITLAVKIVLIHLPS